MANFLFIAPVLFTYYPLFLNATAYYFPYILLIYHRVLTPVCEQQEAGQDVFGIRLAAAAPDDSEAQARENEQMRLAKRMGLIHHLPQGTVDAGTSVRE